MSFVATDSQSSGTNTWLTPKWLLDELGEFDLDPCAAPAPRPFPTAKKMIAESEGDGFSIEWNGRVWLNPPYGKHARLWLEKLEQHGNGIALVFARTDTAWLQPVMERNGIFFLKGRVPFLRPDGTLPEHGGPSTPSILIPYGRKNIAAILGSELAGVWKP